MSFASFEVEHSTLPSGVIVLALSGTMKMGPQLQKFESTLQDMATKRQNKIVLDMSRLIYLDSSAIGVLVSCHSLMRDSGGQLRLAGVSDRVSTIFKMTGVDGVLTVDTNRDASVSVLTASV